MLRLRTLNNRLLFRDFFRKSSGRSGQTEATSQDVVAAMRTTEAGWYAGKIGTTELLALEFAHRWVRPPFPPSASWLRPARRLYIDSGVFPVRKDQFEEFIRTYLAALGQVNALYLWQKDPFLMEFEHKLAYRYAWGASWISGTDLSYQMFPRIADLRWLVVSPFVETMQKQIPKMAQIHRGLASPATFAKTSPSFQFLGCPQFSHLQPSPFSSWTEGLWRLTERALALAFDVALVGAGAWSLPLLANLKQAGKKGIHLGGETQLLFGIKGRRWDAKNLYNEHWVRPSPEETPPNFLRKENGCYW
jgi:hypothetical protein